jgi:hypothetical protein
MQKEVRRFANFGDAEKADREFYKKISGNERIQICLELSALDPDQPLERVVSIRKISDTSGHAH